MKAGTSYSFFKAIQGIILILIPRVTTVYCPQVYYHRSQVTFTNYSRSLHFFVKKISLPFLPVKTVRYLSSAKVAHL